MVVGLMAIIFIVCVFLSVDSQTSSSIGIELCCWRECRGHSVLALVCNNGEPQSTVKLLPFVTNLDPKLL